MILTFLDVIMDKKNIKNLKSRFLIQTHLSAQISNFATLIDRKVKKKSRDYANGQENFCIINSNQDPIIIKRRV